MQTKNSSTHAFKDLRSSGSVAVNRVCGGLTRRLYLVSVLSLDTMETVDAFILLAGVCAIVFAFLLYKKIAQIVIPGKDGKAYGTVTEYSDEMGKLSEIYDLITNGAKSFLFAEYKICGMFVLGFAAVIFVLITVGSSMKYGALTAIAFVLGALTSMAAGYLGMMIAVFANARCAVATIRRLEEVGWLNSYSTYVGCCLPRRVGSYVGANCETCFIMFLSTYLPLFEVLF